MAHTQEQLEPSPWLRRGAGRARKRVRLGCEGRAACDGGASWAELGWGEGFRWRGFGVRVVSFVAHKNEMRRLGGDPPPQCGLPKHLDARQARPIHDTTRRDR